MTRSAGTCPPSNGRPLTQDSVVAVTRIEARMKHSDASVEMTVAIVFTVRDGQIFSGREYATREEALEAAGLLK